MVSSNTSDGYIIICFCFFGWLVDRFTGCLSSSNIVFWWYMTSWGWWLRGNIFMFLIYIGKFTFPYIPLTSRRIWAHGRRSLRAHVGRTGVLHSRSGLFFPCWFSDIIFHLFLMDLGSFFASFFIFFYVMHITFPRIDFTSFFCPFLDCYLVRWTLCDAYSTAWIMWFPCIYLFQNTCFLRETKCRFPLNSSAIFALVFLVLSCFFRS